MRVLTTRVGTACLLIVLHWASTGCCVYGPWKPVAVEWEFRAEGAFNPSPVKSAEESLPWAGGERAGFERRACSAFLPFNLVGIHGPMPSQWRWTGPDGFRVRDHAVLESAIYSLRHDPVSAACYVGSEDRWGPFSLQDEDKESRASQFWTSVSIPCRASIVCIKPLVLVVSHVPTEYRSYEPFRPPKSGLGTSLPRAHSGVWVETRLPFEPSPDWLSPDLHEPCQPVPIGADGRGRIPTPWGALVLERDGDTWVVMAEKAE